MGCDKPQDDVFGAIEGHKPPEDPIFGEPRPTESTDENFGPIRPHSPADIFGKPEVREDGNPLFGPIATRRRIFGRQGEV